MKNPADKRWILQSVRTSPGFNATTCYRIRWFCVEDGTELETTTDATMRNFLRSRWCDIVASPRPWGVYTNIHASTRSTKRGIPVANADYTPVLEDRIDSQADADYLIAEMRAHLAGPQNTWNSVVTEE